MRHDWHQQPPQAPLLPNSFSKAGQSSGTSSFVTIFTAFSLLTHWQILGVAIVMRNGICFESVQPAKSACGHRVSGQCALTFRRSKDFP